MADGEEEDEDEEEGCLMTDVATWWRGNPPRWFYCCTLSWGRNKGNDVFPVPWFLNDILYAPGLVAASGSPGFCSRLFVCGG